MISLVNLLNEVLVTKKTPFGGGTEHSIYQSKRNPNILYKVGKKRTVEKWLTIFKENPYFFPKVYKAGKISDDKFYVEVEKLNTEQVIIDWELIEDVLELIGYIDRDEDEYVDRMFQIGQYNEEMKYFLKERDPKTYELFIKWVNFINNVKKIVKQYTNLTLDVHRYNFGYDSQGNLKCLDI